ncbi:MAG: ribonuclease PH, partial [bacterium]|nr:ribonuclease PH [bacterium]
INKLIAEGKLTASPLLRRVAAISVGICEGVPTLDLDYAHDSTADTDMNVIMTSEGRYVEIQGTAEHDPFDDVALDTLRALAKEGCSQLFAAQAAALNA